MNQLELHKRIDEMLLGGSVAAIRKDISVIIATNTDARQYFFAQADEHWLDWFWENGFLDVVKTRAKDPTKYGYTTPEINYLVKVAAKVPNKIVDIILTVSVSAPTFNPEVIDRFLWICSFLPADQLARMVGKIRDEKWIPLMGVFNRWGFEYEKMLESLSGTKDDASILILAEAILVVRTGEDAQTIANSFGTEKPFYLDDLSQTRVFEFLGGVGDEYVERALSLSTQVMAKVVLLGEKPEEDDAPFSIGDKFYLFDVDFFDLRLGVGKHLSDRDDIRELAAVIVTSLRRIAEINTSKPEQFRSIYKKYIGDFDDPSANIPDSRSMWRLRLFAMSLCPMAFSEELKKAFLRLFEAGDNYHEIISGAEYEKALKDGFSVLSEEDKRQYVDRVVAFFNAYAEDKEDQKWHKAYGSRILSMIVGDLIKLGKKEEVEKAGFILNENYKPEPSIGQMRGGTVIPQAPGDEDDWKKSVPDIVNLLKTELTPAALKKKYKDADFLRPINAEGVAERLKVEMTSRIKEFISCAPLFFDRTHIDSHYTYAFFQNLYNLVRENKIAGDIDFSPVFKVMNAIMESAAVRPFEKDESGDRKSLGWLANWDAVHNAMADLLKEMLGGSTESKFAFETNKKTFLKLIAYLLGHSDPAPKDEELETAKFKTKSGGVADYSVGDPFNTAINSVRGRAFQALVNFTYRDSQLMPKEQVIKLDQEVKTIYENALSRENTRALAFMFGHYLPSFYFRDKDWIRGLLPQIFPVSPEKKYFYSAAWEGYLANSLYEEMFFDPDIQKLYERGIASKEPEDTSRKHFRDPDEGLAVHLALAFMYYKDFGFKYPLFEAFWNDEPHRQKQFVSFLGRMFVSGDNASANKLLKEDPRATARLKEFWDWILAERKTPDLCSEFGFWINLEKGLFDAEWLADHVKNTLEITKGVLGWDYKLTMSIVQFAKEAPEDTLSIARLYLLEGGVRGINHRLPIHIDNEWLEALGSLYKNASTRDGTYTLIDDLIREGGSTFWGLKKIIEK
jgi:hypothetical protein